MLPVVGSIMVLVNLSQIQLIKSMAFRIKADIPASPGFISGGLDSHYHNVYLCQCGRTESWVNSVNSYNRTHRLDSTISAHQLTNNLDRLQTQFNLLPQHARRGVEIHRISLPVLIAPSTFHGMAHLEGKLATIRAAGKVRTRLKDSHSFNLQ